MDYCFFCMGSKKSNTGRCPHCGHLPEYTYPEFHLKPGSLLQERFLIGMSLGEGGFGITYIAKDLKLDLVVAIKEFFPKGFANRSNTLHSEVSTGIRDRDKRFFEKGKERFLDEAKALARLSYVPGIVQVRDFFEENNTAYIVMEYLRGKTLKEYLDDNGAIDYLRAYEVLLPVVKSLAVVHKHGLIHRDISPDNIMLIKSGTKLMDFGAARTAFMDDEHSLTVMMKPGYAPEEQYTRRGIQGPWTDVYALCATFYKCITGEVPLDAISRRMEDLESPSDLGWQVDRQFEKIIMKGLSILPADRYSNMEELLQAFKKWSSLNLVRKQDIAASDLKKEPEQNENTVLISASASPAEEELDKKTVLLFRNGGTEESFDNNNNQSPPSVGDMDREFQADLRNNSGAAFYAEEEQATELVSKNEDSDTFYCPFCGRPFSRRISGDNCPFCGENIFLLDEKSNGNTKVSPRVLFWIAVAVLVLVLCGTIIIATRSLTLGFVLVITGAIVALGVVVFIRDNTT